MAFVQLETLDGDVELIVFPRVYAKFEELLVSDNVLEIEGKINAKDRDGNSTDDIKIFMDKAKILNAETSRMWLKPPEKAEKEADQDSSLTISLKSVADTEVLMKIKSVLDENKGETPVTLLFTSKNQKMRLPGGVNNSKEVMAKIKEIAGVKIQTHR
jgi:DNA polymerase-3 subunit alpha